MTPRVSTRPGRGDVPEDHCLCTFPFFKHVDVFPVPLPAAYISLSRSPGKPFLICSFLRYSPLITSFWSCWSSLVGALEDSFRKVLLCCRSRFRDTILLRGVTTNEGLNLLPCAPTSPHSDTSPLSPSSLLTPPLYIPQSSSVPQDVRRHSYPKMSLTLPVHRFLKPRLLLRPLRVGTTFHGESDDTTLVWHPHPTLPRTRTRHYSHPRLTQTNNLRSERSVPRGSIVHVG